MKAIGIDIGTTGISGVLLDAEGGTLLRSITRASDAFIEGCAPFEKIQSVEKIISIADGILEELMEADVSAIGVTGQMHGIVYVDADGKAVSPLYTWQDGRGDLPYGDGSYASHLGAATGYGCVTDLYNRENGIRPKNAVSFATIHDYYVMHLSSLKEPILHASDAASFGCYDAEKMCFHYDYHPRVEGGYALAGEYRGIPVAVAIGDNQASVLSTAREGDLLINVGTGSQVSMVSPTPVYADGIEVRPYFEGKYLLVGSALCGGRAYSLLKDFYRAVVSYFKTGVSDSEIYRAMDRMLLQEGDTLSVDTRFAGTRTDRTVRGGIERISTENFTPEALSRGFLRGMASELYELYLKMGVRASSLVGSGNGIRKNAPLVLLCEEMFGAKMKTPVHLEEAAFGAALFALISAGVYQNAAEAQALVRFM